MGKTIPMFLKMCKFIWDRVVFTNTTTTTNSQCPSRQKKVKKLRSMCMFWGKNIFKKGKALIQSLATTQLSFCESAYRSFGLLFSESYQQTVAKLQEHLESKGHNVCSPQWMNRKRRCIISGITQYAAMACWIKYGLLNKQ